MKLKCPEQHCLDYFFHSPRNKQRCTPLRDLINDTPLIYYDEKEEEEEEEEEDCQIGRSQV